MTRRGQVVLAPALIGLATLVALVPTSPVWVEQLYSRRLYPVAQQVVTRASSLVDFSLLDPLVAFGLLALVAWWWHAFRHRGERTPVRVTGRMVVNTVAAAATVYLVFVAAWGLNYRREPLTAKLDYDPARITAASLTAVAEESVERLNTLFPQVDADEWPSFDELPDRFGPAFADVQQRLGASRPAVVGVPKRTFLAAYFQRAGVDGMMNPFSLEVLVNHTVLPFERPFLVAHEWSHLAGYANEAEASFVGFLVCLAGDTHSRYSAWLFLLPQLARHLSEEERSEVYGRLADGPRADLRAVAERLSHAVPLVRRNANRVYDRFLRANRVDSGIASYGLVVNLVLGTDGETVWRDRPTRDDMIGAADGDDDV